jgi:hypothetical protein
LEAGSRTLILYSRAEEKEYERRKRERKKRGAGRETMCLNATIFSLLFSLFEGLNDELGGKVSVASRNGSICSPMSFRWLLSTAD